MQRLSALKYYGGKSPLSNNVHIHKRIFELLRVQGRVYMEPFAGMLSMLLNRPKASTEIVNDKSDRIVAFWKALRDEPDEFLRKFSCTPMSETLFLESVDDLDNDRLEGVDKAVAVALCITAGLMSTAYPDRTKFGFSFYSIKASKAALHDRLLLVSKRIEDVVITNRCAIKLLDKARQHEDAVIYVDPPYWGADTSPYGSENTIDFDALKDVLRGHKAKIVLSNYGDFFDDLDWRKENLSAMVANGAAPNTKATPRTEVLYYNFDPPNPCLFD